MHTFIKDFRFIVIAFALFVIAFAAHASCYDCSPQCVPAARKWSGIDVPRGEYARDIPAAAAKDKRFKVHNEPKSPSYGVILDLGKAGHAIAVTYVQAVKVKTATGKKRQKYLLQVAHANADCKCSSEQVTAEFDGGKLTFFTGLLKGRTFSRVVFITYAKTK